MKKRNHGFSLVELVVTMAVASVVMLAATTTLLSYIRINKQGTDIAIKQNNVQIVTEVLESIASEASIKKVVGDATAWQIIDVGDNAIFSYDGTAIYVKGVELLPNVKEWKVPTLTADGLLTLYIRMSEEAGKLDYEMSVYCRLAQVPEATEESEEGNNPVQFSLRAVPTESQTTDWSRIRYADARKNLISVLEAEKGSTGASLTTGEYFSEWYIGGYAGNPGWNQETPWCACFVSWALEQCSENLLTVPKYAHVEEFMNSFPIDRWKTSNPQPGDIIFFDWVENNTKFPQHVGVVTAVENGTVRTIEGNADGEVASRVYALDDGRILGYGVLNWV